MSVDTSADTLPAPPESQERPKRKLGFALQSREFVKECARKGGKAAQATGRTHRFTSEEARIAGRKGGNASASKQRDRRSE